ncbi:MAG: bifunctional precorrin-2 dehydrogenase/sirohydrochlorin ferrochelatase [Chloroflexi bacterium]|nr:bifunctional precorrin-2 dehydrogenase/sirohydrochlorin ferrochelatase [Chloroflexota bacterium]
MRYYPVFLDIAGKPVVVIGGGEVALRKVEGLLEAGARVTVVSPELHPDLASLIAGGRARHIARGYRAGDLEGYTLAFVGTDDRSVNAAVAREGKERGVWVNAVDDPPNCDFIMPGVVRRGDIIVAVSTSGGSPAMARKMREELEAFLTEDYALLLELAAEVRAELRQKNVVVPPQVWNAALDGELRALLAGGRRAQAKERLLRSLLQPAGQS